MVIPFPPKTRDAYYQILSKMFDSNFWSEGPVLEQFEEEFSNYTKLSSAAVANGGAGLLAILEYLDVRGKDVIVPANTFWATPLSAKKAGANVIYADCNRDDLCLSLEDLKQKITPATKAVVLVHIGGHIAFQSEEIAAFCREKDIYLIEDCAHVHGGWWNGKTGGHYGFAGSYSFYATKTMPLGEGGMVVSKDTNFIEWVKQFRNYGKKVVGGKVTYPLINGFNYRMNNVTAALGITQLRRLPEILSWKKSLANKYNDVFSNRIRFPQGMESGYYKYIVFNEPDLREKTGQVFAETDLGPQIEGCSADVPNSFWVAAHHSCPPIYHGWDGFDLSVDELAHRLRGHA